MSDGEKVPIVLIAANEDVLNNVRDALMDKLELLHAQTKDEAIALLEGMKSDIDLAIIELELPDFGAWDLIRQLTRHQHKPLKIIATTSLYPSPLLEKAGGLGFDAVVPKGIPPEDWRRTVETVLGTNETSPFQEAATSV
jgi:DNA-binding NarL/FixJ family response regulator